MVSLPINIVCLIALYKTHHLKSVTRAFLVSLTVADISVSFLFLIPALAASVVNEWPLGVVGCYIHAIYIQATPFRIILSLLAVNVDRFIAIVYPLRHSRWVTLKRARITIFIIWALNPVMFVAMGVSAQWKISYDRRYQYCILEVPKRSYTYFICIICEYGTPILVLIATTSMYLKVVTVARRHKKKMLRMQSRGIRTNNMSIILRRQDTKLALSFLLLVFAVTFSYFPLCIGSVLESFFDVHISETVGFLTEMSYVSGTVLDVLIYYFRNRELRNTMNEIGLRYLRCNRAS